MTCDTWPIVWPCDAPGSATPQHLTAAASAAQSLLWARTGRRLGACTVIEAYSPVVSGTCGVPYMRDDRSWGHGTVGRVDIFLANVPVVEVTEVRVNGRIIAPGGYRVEGARLIRLGDAWPTVAVDEIPPVEVEYRWGIPLDDSPLWGLVAGAMGEVANEILQGMCGGACKLPARAVSVTRGGVTVQLGDPGQYQTANLIGLPLADALIGATNPNGMRTRSRVYSPDMPTVSRPQPRPPVCDTVDGGAAETLFLSSDLYGGDADTSFTDDLDGGNATTTCP